MPEDHEVGDLTREPMEFPMSRDLRLQALARGDEGFLLALGYSTQRGYGRNHPFPAKSVSARSRSNSMSPSSAFPSRSAPSR
jgi:alpha-D-ribose 1-methylphosphonate 5-triphosphate synthase subunit PhnI